MKKIIVDYRITDEEISNLLKFRYEILACPPCESLYAAVCGHPDMLLHIIDNASIMVHKDMPKEFIEVLKKSNINVFLSNSSLSSFYPYDIILNAVSISNLFVHYIDYTDENLLDIMSKTKNLIKVKQGYTKCSTAIVNAKAVITSDIGIAKALNKENIDILLLPPGDIELPGLNYGFIGGTCGLIEEKTMAFYGNLDCYTYGKDVINFLKKHKVEPFYLRKGKLIDRGSILTVTSNQ
ncbi:hypothetical protein GOM49_07520 [Clostridium bovifaecis]|uniref:DUF6873 domain-containing protein n=1 Tax=Clostridium bovifaecis TaxID=2184719 RepID=A0A6I6EMQ5_9CLOT|nr:hypothetical protein GOM49_07520 [Clostridium bovifaecis]